MVWYFKWHNNNNNYHYCYYYYYITFEPFKTKIWFSNYGACVIGGTYVLPSGNLISVKNEWVAHSQNTAVVHAFVLGTQFLIRLICPNPPKKAAKSELTTKRKANTRTLIIKIFLSMFSHRRTGQRTQYQDHNVTVPACGGVPWSPKTFSILGLAFSSFNPYLGGNHRMATAVPLVVH